MVDSSEQIAEEVGKYLSQHQEVASTLPAAGISWVDAHREAASKRFEQLGFPTTRDEQWKYTNVRSIARHAFDLSLNPVEVNPSVINKLTIPNLDAHRLVFTDGIFSPLLSQISDLPKGVTIISLAALLRSDPSRLENKFGEVVGEPINGFNAMNSAFILDGAFIEIESGVKLEKPIELLYVSASTNEQALALPRNIVVLRKQSSATLCERYISVTHSQSLTSSVSEVYIEDNGILHIDRVNEENDKSFNIGALFANVGRNARLKSNSITLGGRLVRNDIVVRLSEDGAETQLDGLYVVNDRQHVDNNTQVLHDHPRTTSREHYKGILSGKARAVFRGHISVKPEAQGADAVQKNNNLLLSPEAEVDTMPQLEIYADDVKCAHGATVGQLEEEAIFYMRSRGIGYAETRQLLTHAFAAEILENLGQSSIKDYIENRINHMMGLS